LTEFIEIADGPLVAGQLSEADVDRAAEIGIRTIINNRPDGEAPGQPRNADLEARARAHGIAYHFVPAISGRLTPEDVEAFGAVMETAEAPVLAFCRTGSRTTALWALAAVRAGAEPDDVIARAAEAGYDLSSLRPVMESLAGKG
jgi:sulfide:quinone oxidoreductase